MTNYFEKWPSKIEKNLKSCSKSKIAVKNLIILKFSFSLPDLVKVPHATGMFWQKGARLVPGGEKQLPQPAG